MLTHSVFVDTERTFNLPWLLDFKNNFAEIALLIANLDEVRSSFAEVDAKSSQMIRFGWSIVRILRDSNDDCLYLPEPLPPDLAAHGE